MKSPWVGRRSFFSLPSPACEVFCDKKKSDITMDLVTQVWIVPIVVANQFMAVWVLLSMEDLRNSRLAGRSNLHRTQMMVKTFYLNACN